MNIVKRIRTSKLFVPLLVMSILAASALLVSGTWYISRGFLRDHVIPGYYYHRYGSTIQKTLDLETQNANTAFRASGIQFAKSMPTQCMLDIAINIHTSIWCGGESRVRAVPITNAATIAADIVVAQSTLKKQGWQGGPDYPWGHGPGASLNYQYTKSYGRLQCTIQLYQSNEIQGMLMCSEDFTFMGDPYKHLD